MIKMETRSNKEIVFYIPYPSTQKGKTSFNKRFGMNAYWSGKHYKARAQDSKEIHDLVFYCLKKEGIRKHIFQVPVEINFYWHSNLDIDNNAVLGKMIVDGLKGYLLKDDGPKYFQKVTHEYWDGKSIKVVIKEYERKGKDL